MRAAQCAIVAICMFASGTHAQGRKGFEVVSVRPAKIASYTYAYLPGGRFKGTLPVEWLIGLAYDIQPLDRIIGEPAWVKSHFFDIDARPSTDVSKADTQTMLRTLLEERFRLKWRKDQGKANVYVLKIANRDGRLGPGIRRSVLDCTKPLAGRGRTPVSQRELRPGVPAACGIASDGRGTVGGGNESLAALILPVKLALGEEVVDRTGLTGTYDFYVRLPWGAQRTGPDDETRASLFTAVQEQLGMRLDREEVTWDTFVVEEISQPLPN